MQHTLESVTGVSNIRPMSDDEIEDSDEEGPKVPTFRVSRKRALPAEDESAGASASNQHSVPTAHVADPPQVALWRQRGRIVVPTAETAPDARSSRSGIAESRAAIAKVHGKAHKTTGSWHQRDRCGRHQRSDPWSLLRLLLGAFGLDELELLLAVLVEPALARLHALTSVCAAHHLV